MASEVNSTSEEPLAQMPARALTRRQALKAGAGFTGLAMALAALPAKAQDANGSMYLPVISTNQIDQVEPDDEPLINAANEDDTDDDGFADAERHLSRRWQRVEAAMGNTAGKVEPGNVFKVDLPRTDISATIGGIVVKPEFALNGEVTFQRYRDREAMKFEVALLDAEVNPVLSALFAEDLQPKEEVFTALHNHYLLDEPQIRFVHGFAVGNAEKMAAALYRALSQNSGTPFGHGEEPPGDPGFDAQRVANIIGGDYELMNGILQVTVERKERFKQRNVRLKRTMEVESMFNFQSIGGGNVATIDEFVLLKDEVNAVARELRSRGFLITALHNHELDIDPEAYYMHSWNTGDPITLATDIRAALELTNSKFT